MVTNFRAQYDGQHFWTYGKFIELIESGARTGRVVILGVSPWSVHLVEGYLDIGSRRIVGIAPAPAFRTLVEYGIEKAAGCPAALADPAEVGETQSTELVETGENRTPRPASLRHGSATGVVSSRFSPAPHR